MAKKTSDQTYSLGCAINSFVSTYIAGILHPLDVIKTRFQSHDGKTQSQNLVPRYRSIADGFRGIYRYQGIVGLYKGFHISMLSQAAATSLFFWIYEYKKLTYLRNGYEEMNAVAIASTQASIYGTLITQPLWVIKTRMLLNTKGQITDKQNFKFSCQQIVKQHGLAGYSRGLGISLLLSISGVIQMYFYEGFKKAYEGLDIPQTEGLQKNFICGAASKLMSVFISYPLTTIRTRVQQNQYVKNQNIKKYSGTIEIIVRTFKDQGIKGFYKGFQANLLKGILQKGVYFYFYQLFKVLFLQKSGQTKNSSEV